MVFYAGAAPDTGSAAYRTLISAGPIQRSGQGRQNVSVRVVLNNIGGRMGSLLSVPPLGAKATVAKSTTTHFSGVLTAVDVGDTVTLQLEG